MSIRDRASSQQVLAVTLALVMLVSMGGMAFVGGVGAQATGGTYDELASDEGDISTAVNVNDGSVVTLSDDEAGAPSVSLNDDGSADLTVGSTADAEDSFAGVAIDEERTAALFDSVDASDGLADQLGSLDDVAISTAGPSQGIDAAGASDAYPVVLIELAPQSDFSQHANLEGDEDFILVAGEADAVTSTGGDSVAAFAVDNDNLADSRQIASNTDFEGVFSDLNAGGTDDSELRNAYVDQYRVGAGVGGSDILDNGDAGGLNTDFTADTDTLTDIDVTAGSETKFVHSEKITLESDGSDDQFFASITAAEDAASTDDTIRLDDGTYSATDLESDPIELAVDGLTVQVDDRATDTPTVESQIDYAAGNVTVDGLTIDHNTNPVVDISDADVDVVNPTLTNSTVDQSGGGVQTAVRFNSDADDGTITNNTIIATATGVFVDDDTGLDIQSGFDEIAGNEIQDFRTQILDSSGNADIQALFDANNFEGNADAQSAIAVDSNGDVLGDAIFGSIDAADDAGAAVEINVSAGDYDGAVSIDSADVTVNGPAETTAEIGGAVTLNSGTAVTFQNFTVTAGSIASNTVGDVTISNVQLTDASQQNIDIDGSGAVTIDAVDIGDADTGGPAIDLAGYDASSVSVTNVDVTDVDDSIGVDIDFPADTITVDDVTLTGTFSGTAVDVDDASGGDVTVTNVTADAAGSNTDGIIVAGIDNTASNAYTVSDNSLTNLGNGLGIDVAAGSPGTQGSIDLSNNELTGGASFIGVQYDLAEAEDVTLVNNTVVGANVQNGGDSVGFQFEAITGLGQDPFAGGSDDSIPFNNNTITGHARAVEEVDTTDPVISEAGYNAILDPTNNNEFGTLVVAPSGNYTAAYGAVENLNDPDGSNSYLPGSVNQAVNLVESSSEVSETTLEVTDTNDLEGVDTYVDEPVTLGSADSITIQGESPGVTVATNFQIDATTETLNNHAVVDLTVDNNNGGPAIQVLSDNAQTDFENLDVTSNGVGLDVDTTGADVNVVTVTDSSFDVSEAASSGIVLAGTSDDRDGYNLTNVTVSGSGIDNGATGLDLTGIDKPGKDGLPVNLSVTETEVDGFEKQVVLSPELASISDLDAEAVYEGTFTGTDQVDIEFTDNSFTHAVLVLEDDGNGESLADTETLYGSINTAATSTEGTEAVSTGNVAIVDVRGTATYAEDVTLDQNDADDLSDLVVRGPQSDTVATDELRDGGEAIIAGVVDLSADTTNYDSVTITGFTIVSDAAQTLNLNQDVNVDVENTAVSSTADDGTNTDGISIGGPAGTVDLTGVFVGDHAAQATTHTSIAVDSAATVTIDNSELNSSADTGDGVNTAAGAVTITDSTIANHAGDGVDAQAAANGVTISNTTVASNGLGVDATAAGGAHELLVNDGSVIDDNGITVGTADVTLTVTDATVENYSADVSGAIQINAANAASAITQTTFDANDVSIAVADGAGVAGDLAVENNAFYGTGDDVAIDNNDAELDATLNYFSNANNSRQGPAATDTPDVTGEATTVYDPFLTTDQTDTDDVSETTAFGHDVVVSSGSATTVGFPAQVEDGLTLADVFDTELEGAVYELKDDGTFGLVQEDFEDREVEAFDAYVVENTDEMDSSVLIEYDSDQTDTEVARTQFEEGLNFVPATRAGTVDSSLFPGGDTDYVAAPFELGDNLYGVGDQTNADFVQDPAAAGFGENFRNGAGDQIVHPHAGYLVIVNEESNDGLTVAEQITKPATVTAGNVADRTDNTDTADTDAFFDVSVTGSSDPTAGAQNTFDVTVDVTNLGDEDDIQTLTIEEVSTSGTAGTIDLPQDENLRVNGGQTKSITFTATTDGNGAAGDTITVEVSSEDSSASETIVLQA